MSGSSKMFSCFVFMPVWEVGIIMSILHAGKWGLGRRVNDPKSGITKVWSRGVLPTPHQVPRHSHPGAIVYFVKTLVDFQLISIITNDDARNAYSVLMNGGWPVPLGGAHWLLAGDFCFQGCLLMTNTQGTAWTWGASIVGILTCFSLCTHFMLWPSHLKLPSVFLTRMHGLPGSSCPSWIILQGLVHQQGCPALPRSASGHPCLNRPCPPGWGLLPDLRGCSGRCHFWAVSVHPSLLSCCGCSICLDLLGTRFLTSSKPLFSVL